MNQQTSLIGASVNNNYNTILHEYIAGRARFLFVKGNKGQGDEEAKDGQTYRILLLAEQSLQCVLALCSVFATNAGLSWNVPGVRLDYLLWRLPLSSAFIFLNLLTACLFVYLCRPVHLSSDSLFLSFSSRISVQHQRLKHLSSPLCCDRQSATDKLVLKPAAGSRHPQ